MKRMRFAGIILLSVFLMAACGKKDADSTVEKNNTEPAVTHEMEVPEEQQDDTENVYSESETQEESREVKIYYIDDSTAEPVSEVIMIKDENDIWSALQEKGILDDACKLLNFDVDQENGKIDLDFNAALGDRIRSFGTTGETEIIGCLINTYLDAYDCKEIRITEEGATLETSSGASFDGYSGRIEF